MDSRTDINNTGEDRGGETMPLLDSTAFPLYLLQHGSKEDINILADADLSTPGDLHQQITRATNISDSL